MRDFNAVIKNKQNFEKLGWILTPAVSSNINDDWILMTYTPNNRKDYLTLSNDNFVEELESVIENYDLNDYIEDALSDPKLTRPNYKVLVEDGGWFKDQLVKLYDSIKNKQEFRPDDEYEEEEADSDEEDLEDDTRKKSKK